MEELEVRPGDILASKYRVEKVLGAGGMGIVVAARHIALDKLVAVKIMLPRALTVQGAAERFQREARAAAQLHSKHVVQVSDVGKLESGLPYMSMEHLHGSDLASVIEKRGAVALPDAAEYLLQACDAIGEAHAKGIVHRDLKPANLFLLTEPDGAPLIKVLDFGIAKIAGDQGLTGTSQGMGSGGYMSPEQMSSAKKVDHRCDIWALGVTLYELLTARRPFEADSLEQFVTRVFWEPPTPLSAHRPDLPPQLGAIILRCLEKQPDARFSSVAHFAHLLGPYAPPRAHGYVARIAKALGVDAPNLAQTSAAFGPAPPVAVAALAPARGAVSPPAPMPAQRPLAASQSGPYPIANQSGPYPIANQSGPYPVANQSGPYPTANQSGPHPLVAPRPGGAAVASGPYVAIDPRASAPALASTDLTGERLHPPAPRKVPALLLAAGAVVLLALGGGAMWLAIGPSAAPTTTSTVTVKAPADSAPAGVVSVTGVATVTTPPGADVDAPPSATPVSPVTTVKAGPTARPGPATKTGPTATASAPPSVTASSKPTTGPMSGTRQ